MIQNTGKFAGKTVFITGASRGIGKCIAEKLAKDGANIVIAAKTADANPKLPGTIYTAAEELEKLGGKCLPCVVDVRDEDQVQSAVESAVKKFGSLDILVNNASAISLTGTLETPMKRYDLMHGVNTRGTYLVSQKCIPYLKQAKNPHILNISPPLNMSAKWFANHVAYTMAKYGMSMCVLGMSEELHSSKIAVNGLWPRTGIWTAAMAMLGGDEASKQCRKPEIMADAAYVILGRNSSDFTGNFCIDDVILREEGVTNFDQYAIEPGHPLLPDFFLDEAGDPETVGRILAEQGGKPKWEVKKESETEAPPPSVANLFEQIKPLITTDLVSSAGSLYVFNLTGGETGTWYLDLKTAPGSCGSGDPSGDPDVSFTTDSDMFVQMFLGKVKPTAAVMSGKMKFKGDMGKAIKLEKIMKDIKIEPAKPTATGAAAGAGQVSGIFDKLKSVINQDLVGATQAVYLFNVTGSEAGSWHLDLKNGSGACGSGDPSNPADVTFTLDTAAFVEMFTGKLKATAAFMQGKLKIKGDMGKAIKLEKLMGQMKGKL